MIVRTCRRMAGRIASAAAIMLVVCGVFGTFASASSADTLKVSVSTGSPVSGIPLTLTFSGSDTPYDSDGDTPELYALVRPNNGVGCQETYGQDMQVAGTTAVTNLYDADNNYNTVSDGNYSYPSSFTPAAGSYIVCAWLETDGNDYAGKGDTAAQVVGSASAEFTAANTDTLNVSVSTTSPQKGIPLTLTFGGSDTPYDSGGDTPVLYALVRPNNGVGCQPTFGQDQQVAGTTNVTVLYDSDNNSNTVSDGNYSYPSSFTPKSGSYIVCAWLETDGNDYAGKGDVASQVVTASASTSFAVQAAPAPAACVVPKYGGATLAVMRARLKAANCRVGVIYYRRDRKVRRGRVVRLGVKVGRTLKHDARVAVYISLGRRR